MKRSLLFIVGACFAGLASAISTSWHWTSNGSDWQTSSSVYFVYSTTKIETGAEVVAAANAGYGAAGAASAAGDTAGSAWDSSVTAPDGAATLGHKLTISPTSGNTVDVGIKSPSLPERGNYYFYLVVFNNSNASDATAYAVAQAGATGEVYLENQVGNQQVYPTETAPDPLQFLDPVWIAGTYREAAPEPTALALLALGLAGAALRRRVR